MTPAISRRPPPPQTTAPKKNAQAWLMMIGMAVLGGVIGYVAARHGVELLLPVGEARWIRWVTVGSLPLVWFLVVAGHEVGHLVGGKLVGGRFLLFVVGPLRWQRTPRGVRFGWNRSSNLIGGMAACVPLDSRDLPRRLGAMIAGGPVASALLATAALWLAVGFGQLGWILPQHVAVATALISAFILVVTAVPGEGGGFKTDGRRLLDLARGGPLADQEAALLALTVGSLGGVRPAAYDRATLARSVTPAGPSLSALYGHFHAYLHHADRGEWAAAQEHLDRVVADEARLPEFVRHLARAEYAWLLAVGGNDPSAARAWLATVPPIELDPATPLRAEAAVLLAEGRRAEAAEKARVGLVALETRSLAPTKSAFAEDALLAVLRRAGEAETVEPVAGSVPTSAGR